MKYIIAFTLFLSVCSGLISKDKASKVGRDNVADFKVFQSFFKKDSLPYEVTVPSAMYHPFGPGFYGTQFIPEERTSSFSRMTRSNMACNSRLLKTDSFVLLSYTIEESNADFMAPVTTFLATFDSTGNRIDKIEFAGQASPDFFKTGLIDENHHIVVKQYLNKWLYDPREKGYMGNKVIGKDLLNTTYYTLSDNGHFAQATEKIIEKRAAISTGY